MTKVALTDRVFGAAEICDTPPTLHHSFTRVSPMSFGLIFERSVPNRATTQFVMAAFRTLRYRISGLTLFFSRSNFNDVDTSFRATLPW